MKKLTTIEGLDLVELDSGAVRFIGDVDVDIDGSDANGKAYDPRGDRYYQPRTSLQHNGVSLDARSVPYVVVPLQLPSMVKGVVLGCKAVVEDLLYGQTVIGVVGDLGPSTKDGEVSVAMAELLGLDSSPVHGGCDQPRFRYTIFPDVPAVVNGVTYTLQPMRKKA